MADPVNYALQVGASVSDMLFNARELLQQPNIVCAACQKRRGPLPPVVTALLTLPFTPKERIPLLRPRDLQVVYVRRQHILDVYMDPRKKNSLDQDPAPDSSDTIESLHGPSASVASSTVNFLDAPNDSEDDDIMNIIQQNRPLEKRRRLDVPREREQVEILSETGSDRETSRTKRTFRPSSTQRRVHRAITSEKYKGKSCQVLLEHMQHSDQVSFLPSPPVLRSLYDFGFGIRGLSVMHCKFADVWDRVDALESSSNFTDFSEKNSLKPATRPRLGRIFAAHSEVFEYSRQNFTIQVSSSWWTQRQPSSTHTKE
ncbi:hypothetical protein DVH05_027627 [Phytophthora capsici]|nr:hypothetical protein DVH05_027627 [Phytophthora capsici]